MSYPMMYKRPRGNTPWSPEEFDRRFDPGPYGSPSAPGMGGGSYPMMPRGSPSMSSGMSSGPMMNAPGQSDSPMLTPRIASTLANNIGQRTAESTYLSALGSNPSVAPMMSPGGAPMYATLGGKTVPQFQDTPYAVQARRQGQIARNSVVSDITAAPFFGPNYTQNRGFASDANAQAGQLTGAQVGLAGSQSALNNANAAEAPMRTRAYSEGIQSENWQEQAKSHAARADDLQRQVKALNDELTQMRGQNIQAMRPGPTTRPTGGGVSPKDRASMRNGYLGSPIKGDQYGIDPNDPEKKKQVRTGETVTGYSNYPGMSTADALRAAGEQADRDMSAQGGIDTQAQNVTPEEYDALPSGAPYMWNGQQVTKR